MWLLKAYLAGAHAGRWAWAARAGGFVVVLVVLVFGAVMLVFAVVRHGGGRSLAYDCLQKRWAGWPEVAVVVVVVVVRTRMLWSQSELDRMKWKWIRFVSDTDAFYMKELLSR